LTDSEAASHLYRMPRPWTFTTAPIDEKPWAGCVMVSVEGHPAMVCWSAEGADAWISKQSPLPLSDAIAGNRSGAGAEALITNGHQRLGRIPRHLWPSYDALVLEKTHHSMVVLSAHAREMFPDHPDALVQVRWQG
jgi:hypothetical protein